MDLIEITFADIIDEMIDHGGTFARCIALAWQAADPANRERLYAAFTDLFDKYKEHVAARKSKEMEVEL